MAGQGTSLAGRYRLDTPANLLITPDGQVKITDFGIASVTRDAPLTFSGMSVYPEGALSPETVVQVTAAQPAQQADPPGDGNGGGDGGRGSDGGGGNGD